MFSGAKKRMIRLLQSIECSIVSYEKTNSLATPLTQEQIEAATNAAVAFLKEAHIGLRHRIPNYNSTAKLHCIQSPQAVPVH